jgi:hypothetical protein
MPKILIYKNWIFVFFPTDIYENKKHVHIGKKDTFNLCKIWIEPDVEIAKAGDLTKKQQSEVLEITKKYRKELLKQWDNFINGKELEIIKVK